MHNRVSYQVDKLIVHCESNIGVGSSKLRYQKLNDICQELCPNKIMTQDIR